MKVRHLMTGIAGTALAIGIAASPAQADGSVRLGNNEAGVVYRSYGDIFEIWDNVDDDKAVYVKWAYNSALNGAATLRVPVDYSSGYTYNLELDESRGTVYFKVCQSSRCSGLGSSNI
jgi:ABC-type molybdate transport system substrate-binding protein